MLRTRLWMGAVLIALSVGMLIVDQHLMPWAPFLFVFVVGLGLAACHEMIGLLGANRRALTPLCYGGIAALGLASWVPHLHLLRTPGEPWLWILGTFTGLVLASFVLEMARFKEPGDSVERIARTIWVVAYLGLLPSFFAQLRWLGPPEVGTTALALAIFVPKGCDIGAYTVGRLIGRHKMTLVLSPKKTWEGAAGGLVTAALVAIAINRLGPAKVLGECWAVEIAFGVTVGSAGMLGDLAESLIKRDCQRKDASQTMPGFGGVLDVVDAVIFAAPVVYLWILLLR
jgi:phosphatidate cytidylyltransferase